MGVVNVRTAGEGDPTVMSSALFAPDYLLLERHFGHRITLADHRTHCADCAVVLYGAARGIDRRLAEHYTCARIICCLYVLKEEHLPYRAAIECDGCRETIVVAHRHPAR